MCRWHAAVRCRPKGGRGGGVRPPRPPPRVRALRWCKSQVKINSTNVILCQAWTLVSTVLSLARGGSRIFRPGGRGLNGELQDLDLNKIMGPTSSTRPYLYITPPPPALNPLEVPPLKLTALFLFCPFFPFLHTHNQGIYRYFLFPFKKSEMKIGKATYSLFSIDNLQTKIGKGLKLPFTHFRFNIVK